jgi:hypothetical protein
VNAAPALIFSWSSPRPRARALIVFVIASVIVHAFGFYIFQIVYPPTVTLIPPPARITLITGDDPESVSLLRWIEAEDPALTTTTQRPPDSKTYSEPVLEHQPSYAGHQPQLRRLPETPPDFRVPSSMPIGIPPLPRPQPPAAVLQNQTIAQFSEAANQLGDPVFPSFAFHGMREDAPANARFHVAIRDGIVRYCFLVESSGDAVLDDQARRFLLLTRFPNAPLSSDIIWTAATVLWGNDIARTNPSPSIGASP